MILLGVGGLIALVGGIWLLVVAFQESILWGLGCLFVPFVGIVFAIMHWPVARRPVLVWAVGFVLILAGSTMGGGLSR
jgi:hypothetical protein